MPAGQPPWRCPVCRCRLSSEDGGRRLACAGRHSFDRAREGYVNLVLRSGRGRQPGDSAEMVAARRRFLAGGAYAPLTAAVAAAIAAAGPATVLDVGCGDGHHTRALGAPTRMGVDVAKPAVAAAARSDPDGWYAVASAAELPLADGSVEAAVDVFGPVFASELERVVGPGGTVVAAHPGPGHLAALRRLVYDDPRPHEVKSPLRGSSAFEEVRSTRVEWELGPAGAGTLRDLFSMTPYRWHAPTDIGERLDAAAAGGLVLGGDVVVTTYRRRPEPGGPAGRHDV